MSKADEALKDVRGWLCDNLSNGDVGKVYSMCRMLYVVSRHANELEEENDKLRVERDHWHVEQVHAYGNWEDAHKRASELEAENAKLRELASGMYGLLELYDKITGNSFACETKRPMIFGEDKSFKDVMCELGIEVDA